MKKLFMKAFEWLRRIVTAIKTMNGERLTNKEVVVTDSLNAHPSALNSPNETLLVRAERTTFGMYVRRMGFEQVRRENKRYFALRAN